jgi:hypothetical protein
LHELLFASAITIINKSISPCLKKIFFQPWMHVYSFFVLFSQHDKLFFPGFFFLLQSPFIILSQPSITTSSLIFFFGHRLYITYIHIDTCVWCEITLRVYECVYTLSKGNKREKERIIGKKERHCICIYTYYYYYESKWMVKKKKEITQCMNKQRAYNDCLLNCLNEKE